MSEIRPFPDQPNVEFDRKAAKKLLRQYHGDVVRQARALEYARSADEWNSAVRSLMASHKAKKQSAGRSLAAYVPRFYGMTPREVFDEAISESDARIAVARAAGQPSWNALLAAPAPERKQENYWEVSPLQQAAKAIKSNDVEQLKTIIQEHPVVGNPPPYEREHGATLANIALGSIEADNSPRVLSDEMRDYLESLGVDLQAELNMRLCNPFTARTVENVQALLDAGADPDWLAPTGFSMLEHALLVIWNSAVIDRLAFKATPRKALWISAGLGDVQGVASFLGKDGKPTAAARDLRSPFDCARIFHKAPLFYPDDDELLIEALSVAAFNDRANVIDYLASRGVNLDNMVWGVPVVNLAVGNGWLESVKALVRNGANLDIPSENSSNGTARDMARWMWNNSNDSPMFRQIAELCGLDIGTLRAEREAKTPKDPPFHLMLRQALAYAQQAALTHKLGEVNAEHLLMGMLRLGGLPLLFYTNTSKLDRDRFNADIMPIALAIQEPQAGIAVPFGANVQGFLEDAKEMARKRYSDNIGVLNVLYAMTRHESGYAVELMHKYGGSVPEFNRELRRAVLNEFK